MGNFKSKPRNAPPMINDDAMEKIASSLPGAKYKRKHPRVGYQKRTDILFDNSYRELSNVIPSPQPYVTKQDMVREHYNKLGAIVPPVPTRERVHDGVIQQDVPVAVCIKSCAGVTARHNAFYDVRTGEIILVVNADSKADHFYTRYYEGKSTFPHVGRMKGAEIKLRLQYPPMMLTIHNNPVFWGYAEELEAKIANDKTFAAMLKEAKKDWRIAGTPPTMNGEMQKYPKWDMPRLRFVQMEESTIKRVK
jgi:hypothetical protein